MALKKDELYQELLKDIKKANTRIRALEQDPNVNSYALDIAKKDIKTYLKRKQKKTRFRVNKKMSYNDLQKEKRAVDKFLKSKSSLKSEIKKFTKQQEESFKAVRGWSLNDKEKKHIYKFLNSGVYKKLKSLDIPSDTIINEIKKYNGDFKKMAKDLEKDEKGILSSENQLDAITLFKEYINKQTK